MPEITQNAGGCHVVIDIINYLVINGYSANMLFEKRYKYKEAMLFSPIHWTYQSKFNARQIVSTIWISVFRIYSLIKKNKIPLINFIQGYENYFENGAVYNSVALTHKMADEELVVSQYLQNKIKKNFDFDTTLIPTGINYDLIAHRNTNKKVKNITFVMRNNPMKGDYILSDIIKQLDNKFSGLSFTVIYMSKEIEIPSVRNNSLEKIIGPTTRLDLIGILNKTDVYVDASVNEGFGLIGLEAMASGAVPVMSDSFGVREYLHDRKNGYLVKRVNDSDEYVSKIGELIQNPNRFQKMKDQGFTDTKSFDYDNRITEYIQFFSKERRYFEKQFIKEEKRLISERSYSPSDTTPKGMSIIKIFNMFLPKIIRKTLKKTISWLYSLYEK